MASAAASQPPVPIPTDPTPISDVARSQARVAITQALEFWGSGRSEQARSMVGLALTAMNRQLPADCSGQELGSLLEHATFSASGAVFALASAETLLSGDATTGQFLGLRVHDYAGSQPVASISPQGSFIVAPSGADFVVYDTHGLAQRLRIPARREAPFSFIANDLLVTVRLGEVHAPPASLRALALQRRLQPLPALLPGASAAGSLQSSDEGASEQVADDEIIVVNIKTGKIDKVLRLAVPPDAGMLRKVASLPPSRLCNDVDTCGAFESDPAPIGRRVDQLKVAAGLVVASWQGGSTTFHRLADSKLVGAFRSRGERWKPGLVAVWPNPPRAAVATSLPNVGRGTEPPFSVTALLDLARGRIIDLIDECRWTTALAFSDDGTKLMVGDLRKGCLHDARTGRHLETTDELRPTTGTEDDLQDVTIDALPEGRWLLRTLDGTYGVFDEKKGATLVRGKTKGNHGVMTYDDKSLYLTDFSGSEAQLLTFGPAGIERRLLRVEELEQRSYPPEAANSREGRRAATLEKVMRGSCVMEGFRLPSELCQPGNSSAGSSSAP